MSQEVDRIREIVERHISNLKPGKLQEPTSEKVIEKTTHIDNDFISGKTFVITGTVQGIKRKELITNIETKGGKVSSSVSKNTDYLICGKRPGSKLAKAESLDIAILYDTEFLQKL